MILSNKDLYVVYPLVLELRQLLFHSFPQNPPSKSEVFSDKDTLPSVLKVFQQISLPNTLTGSCAADEFTVNRGNIVFAKFTFFVGVYLTVRY